MLHVIARISWSWRHTSAARNARKPWVGVCGFKPI